jgi:hypothetical protein
MPLLASQKMKLGIQRLERLVEQIKRFDTRIIHKRWGPEVKALETSIEGTLASIFGNNTFEYNRYIDAADLDKGPVTQEAQQYVSEGDRKDKRGSPLPHCLPQVADPFR